MDEPIDVMGEPGLAFSADGSLLVARCHSKIVILDSRTGEVRRVLWTSRTGGSRSTVAVSPDGSKIAALREATSGDMDRLFIWDANTGELLVWAPVEYPLGIAIRTLLFTPDGSALVGICSNMVALLDPDTGALRSVSSPVEGRVNRRNTCDIQKAVFSPDGNTLACASYEGVVRLHDPRTNAWTGAIGRTGGRPPQIHAIALSPDGSTLASGSKDGAMRFWDTETGRLRDTRRLHGGGIWRLAYSPNGRMLATSGDGHPLRLWDPQSLKLIEEPEMPDARSRPIAFSPGGALLATSAGELTREENTSALIVIDLRTGDRCELPCLEDESAPSSIVFSPDGTLLATTSNGRAAVRSAHTGAVLGRPSRPGWLSRPTFSPCGRYLVFTNYDGLEIFDLRAEQHRREIIDLHGTFPMSEAFSPDGRWLLVGLSDNGSVALYEVPAWREHVRLFGHRDGVSSVSWSPDGQRIYSGSDDGTIKVWDPWTPRLLATLAVLPPRHEGAPEDEWVSYTPHGPFACSENAHQYIQWRQNDELLPYPAHADRRLPDLSGWLMT
jgi:WD40 repeat protein